MEKIDEEKFNKMGGLIPEMCEKINEIIDEVNDLREESLTLEQRQMREFKVK